MKEMGGGGKQWRGFSVRGTHVGSGGEPGLGRLEEGKENVGIGVLEAREMNVSASMALHFDTIYLISFYFMSCAAIAGDVPGQGIGSRA